MLEYSHGMAVEFLFSTSIQESAMLAVCKGRKPRPVQMTTAAVPCEAEFVHKCDN